MSSKIASTISRNKRRRTEARPLRHDGTIHTVKVISKEPWTAAVDSSIWVCGMGAGKLRNRPDTCKKGHPIHYSQFKRKARAK